VSGRVLITIPHLAPWGTEAQTLLLARALVEGGREVRVCCFYGHDAGVVGEFREAGVAVSLLGLRREQGLAPLLRRLAAEISRERPDVLHAQYLTPGLPALLAGRWSRVPRVFATVHHCGAGFGARERLLMRVAAGLSATVFCVSRAVERSWFGSSTLFEAGMGRRPPRHCTLYNALAPAPAGAAAGGGQRALLAALGLGERGVVGVVGRLSREKGHDTLLAALPAIAARHPGAQLLVVGSGPEEARLRLRADALGVAGSVVWAGWRSRVELQALRGAMDVAVVPSTSEGFGLSAAEAAAAGLPVVATAVGGLPEVVDHGVTGLLVPAGDPAALAAAIGRLLEDEALRRSFGAAGRRVAAERFSYARYAGLVSAVYNLPVSAAARVGQ
jgi:glycosyltransferase involved in cell wall biosynthesis